MNNKEADQSARMHRLVCAFDVHKPLKTHFVVMRHVLYTSNTIGLRRGKTCLRAFANKKGADQPAHLCSLISAFVFRLLESIISRHTKSVISMFKLVSVAEQAGLNIILSETPKTDFLMLQPNCNTYVLNQCMRIINPTRMAKLLCQLLI